MEDFLLQRVIASLTFAANVLIFSVAIRSHRIRATRYARIFAISSALGALATLIPWLVFTESEVFYQILEWVALVDLMLWTTAVCLMFRELDNRSISTTAIDSN